MTSKVDVSVVIPTLDRSDRLRRALDSVRDQTQSPTEVIVVDGGEESQTKEVIDDYEFDITYIHQQGTGLSNARNLGIEASDCELIAFLDDDDWWVPEKLERQITTLESTDAAFVFTGVKHTSPNEGVVTVHQPSSVPNSRSILTRNSVGTPSTVLIRKKCLDSIGDFDESLPTREEWDLYIRLLQKYDAEFISSPLIMKESHEDTISRDTDSLERDWKALFEKHQSKYSDPLEEMFWANYQFVLGRSYAKSGNMSTACVHFFRSLQHRFVPKRVGYLFATLSGQTGYDFATKVYRRIRMV
jgi:glycosyltransferase involved in cell wall biosynthesis